MFNQLRWQIILAGAGVLAIGAILLLVADRGFEPRPVQGGRFVEAMVGRPQTLNPLLARSDSELSITRLVFGGLTRPSAAPERAGQSRFEPDLAERWEISADGMRYTFHLRPDAFWHDMQPVTADDVVFTVGLAQSPDIPAIQKSLLTEPWQRARVKALDPRTVEVTLDEPFAPFLAATVMGILPRHVLADVPPSQLSEHRFSRATPIGAGPYQIPAIGELDPDTIFLERFPAHWSALGGGPFLDSVSLKAFPSVVEAIAAIGRREVNGLGGVPSSALSELGDEVQIYSSILSGYLVIYLNPSEPVFRSASVRQALSLALDRQHIVDSPELLGGDGALANGPIPTGSWAHDASLAPAGFDPERARQILDEAGWIDSDGDGLRDRDGQPLRFTLSTPGDSELFMAIAEDAAEAWRAIGVEAEIQAVAEPNLAVTLRSRAFSALVHSVSWPSYDPDPYPFWHSSQASTPGQNVAGYASEDADALLAEARRLHPESQARQRAELYREFQQRFATDMPALILCYPIYNYVLADAGVGGVQLPPLIVDPSDRFLDLGNWFTRTQRGIGED